MLAIGAFALAGIAIVADPFGWLSGRTEGPRIHTIRVAYPLEHPWSLAFLPNGDMLVTERPGRLRIIRNGKLDAAWIPGVPRVVQKAQAGLMDVAIHPHFAENGFIYLTFGLSRARRAVGAVYDRPRCPNCWILGGHRPPLQDLRKLEATRSLN